MREGRGAGSVGAAADARRPGAEVGAFGGGGSGRMGDGEGWGGLGWAGRRGGEEAGPAAREEGAAPLSTKGAARGARGSRSRRRLSARAWTK